MLAFLWNALLCSTIPTYLQCHIDVGVHLWWSLADLVDFLKFLHQTAVSRQLHDLHSARQNTHTVLKDTGKEKCHMHRKHKNLTVQDKHKLYLQPESQRGFRNETHILFLHHLWGKVMKFHSLADRCYHCWVSVITMSVTVIILQCTWRDRILSWHFMCDMWCQHQMCSRLSKTLWLSLRDGSKTYAYLVSEHFCLRIKLWRQSLFTLYTESSVSWNTLNRVIVLTCFRMNLSHSFTSECCEKNSALPHLEF